MLYGGGGFFAIEVKSAERVRGENLRGLRAFAEDYPEARRMLLYRGRDVLTIDGVHCMPVDTFLRQLHPQRGLPGMTPATPVEPKG